MAWAISITSGRLAIDKSELVPTACEPYPGQISYSSESMEADAAVGIAVAATAKII